MTEQIRVKNSTRAAVVFLALLAPPAAGAQKPGLPLQKSPAFVDKRSLTIPGQLPVLQRTQPVAPRKSKKKVLPRTPPPSSRARRPAAPPRATSKGQGYGQIKKTAGGKCRPLRSTDRVQFEFKAADIKDVVSAISKTMCKNFIITQKVRSQKFDILSPTPITVAEAWRAFLSALQANDFTIVVAGKYHKIIQANDGTRSPVPIYDADQSATTAERMVTKVFRLQHAADPNRVVNYLNIFKSTRGQIHPFHETRTIIATDFGSSLARLERILKEIDRPGILEQVHVVPVEFAAAQEIADKLTQVFEPQKAGARKATKAKVVKKAAKGGGGGGAVSVSKIIADERTNNLIIIASKAALKQILALKKQLDVPGEASDGLVHVLRLKHSDAEELASTLSSLASGSGAQRRGGAAARRKKARTKSKGVKSAALFQGEVKVTADKATNSLVITASKLDLQSVKRVVEQLDVPRLQVFVEAVILEVSLTRDRNLGMSWFSGVPTNFGGNESAIVFGSQHSELNALTSAINPLSLVSLLGFAATASGPPIPNTEGTPLAGIPSLGIVLQALQSSNDINVISTPHLLTLDNEEAEIQVNERRPFPAGLSLGGLGGLGGALGGLAGQAGGQLGNAAGALGNIGGLGLGSVAINREDVGLTLKLTPQINDQEYVRLEIDQELSDVAGLDQVTQQTITSKRSAKTTVVVRDQDSVVIGGLVRDKESANESKVPLLGDLPLIGWLFKRQQKNFEKTNLILIITPYIIRGPEDFRKIYERKMEERKEFVDRFYGTAPDYQASIDWTRKLGPIAKFRRDFRKEMTKPENGGPGEDGEQVIKADEPATQPASGDEMPEGDGEAIEVPSPSPTPTGTPPIRDM